MCVSLLQGLIPPQRSPPAQPPPPPPSPPPEHHHLKMTAAVDWELLIDVGRKLKQEIWREHSPLGCTLTVKVWRVLLITLVLIQTMHSTTKSSYGLLQFVRCLLTQLKGMLFKIGCNIGGGQQQQRYSHFGCYFAHGIMYCHASQTIRVEIGFLSLYHSQGASLGLDFKHCCETFLVYNTFVNPTDCFYNFRPFIAHLQHTFPSCYNPSQELSIDEAVVKCRGWAKGKVYMPEKVYKARF